MGHAGPQAAKSGFVVLSPLLHVICLKRLGGGSPGASPESLGAQLCISIYSCSCQQKTWLLLGGDKQIGGMHVYQMNFITVDKSYLSVYQQT